MSSYWNNEGQEEDHYRSHLLESRFALSDNLSGLQVHAEDRLSIFWKTVHRVRTSNVRFQHVRNRKEGSYNHRYHHKSHIDFK